ncbi:diguanylate cyclase (GGDEF)-like protein [Ruminococcaceae bacterium R-25]|nr:diguanylate cyclase (GGDEF)-like protein [Ruminococcaceae bacterium R-25]SUQ11828.1 diguanylate cyclase (GGDEF) domain-containing protein [Oscillospiraceae bacterium]
MLTFLGRGSAFADEHNSAFFIDNGNLILIDCPMSSFEKLNDMNLTLFDHIYLLVTHTHGDHVSGIGMLVDLLQFSVQTPITIVAPSKEVEGDLFYLLSRIEGCNDSWYDLTCAEELEAEWLVCSIQTTHTEELAGKCFGYCLTVDGNRVVYTGDTNTLIPYEKYISDGSYLFTEVSAYKSPVHLYCVDIHDKIKYYVERGVHVYLMHMDEEKRIGEILSDTGAEFAPLEKRAFMVQDTARLLDGIFTISDSLYKDMCMNNNKDHQLLFSYLTELGKTIVDADRASFWKWDKRKNQIWTMSATGVEKIVIPDDSGLVGKALREKTTVITNDPYNDPDFNNEIDIQTGYKTNSVLVLPVADVNGDFIGALQLINKNDENGFDEDEDPKKLSLAALVCGIALESETFLEDSHHDRLTGLKNRMGFYYDFGKRFREYLIPESGKIMSVFICDIDRFKRVNDTYGHNAGDDVLIFSSELLESFCGETDSVYRWGGEEFVMVMRDTDLTGAAKKAEDIRLKLMESDITADGNTIRCTMSFGCSLFDPSKSIEENISNADERLYTAKETGRNKVCCE